MRRSGGPDNDVLRVENLTVSHGKVSAVQDASLTVHAGEVVALVGPNSAGKTSALHGIMGVGKVRTSGRLDIGEQRIDRWSVQQRLTAGLRLVPQGRQLFPTLTVDENLRVVSDQLGVSWSSTRDQARAMFPEVFVGFADSYAGNLSGGQQQMVALARAMVGDPTFILLDEPALGLASGVISRLCQVMQELASSGVGVVVTDQNLGQWESVIDRAVPLLRGRTMSAIHTQTELMAVLGHKTA